MTADLAMPFKLPVIAWFRNNHGGTPVALCNLIDKVKDPSSEVGIIVGAIGGAIGGFFAGGFFGVIGGANGGFFAGGFLGALGGGPIVGAIVGAITSREGIGDAIGGFFAGGFLGYTVVAGFFIALVLVPFLGAIVVAGFFIAKVRTFFWGIGVDDGGKATCNGCGQEVDRKLITCSNCGTPVRYPLGTTPKELTPSDLVLLEIVPRSNKEPHGVVRVQVDDPPSAGIEHPWQRHCWRTRRPEPFG